MLYLAHYLNHIEIKKELRPSQTNGRIKTGNSPSIDQSDINDVLSTLETEIKTGNEQVIITNTDGEILLELNWKKHG